MKKARKMPELILRLKAQKAELGLSNNDIAAKLQEKGYSTSLSTVKRVFAEGSEHQSFWYGESIQPIEEILLIEATPVPVENLESLEEAQQYVSHIEGLQAAASFKDELMEELRNSNAELKASLEKKDKAIETLAHEISSYKKKLWIVIAAFILLVFLVLFYLIIHDIPNPEYGIFSFKAFMEETSAFFSNGTTGVGNLIVNNTNI